MKKPLTIKVRRGLLAIRTLVVSGDFFNEVPKREQQDVTAACQWIIDNYDHYMQRKAQQKGTTT